MGVNRIASLPIVLFISDYLNLCSLKSRCQNGISYKRVLLRKPPLRIKVNELKTASRNFSSRCWTHEGEGEGRRTGWEEFHTAESFPDRSGGHGRLCKSCWLIVWEQHTWSSKEARLFAPGVESSTFPWLQQIGDRDIFEFLMFSISISSGPGINISLFV